MATLSSVSDRLSNRLSLASMRAALRREPWLAIIVAGHFFLALWYSMAIPPWEAHDEWPHYRYAAYIAENLALPDPNQRLTTEFEFDEVTQPPLYYILASIPMLLVDTQDGYRPVVNPYAPRGTGEAGVNFVLHDPDIEKWPWRGTLLALHLGRFVSVLIGSFGLLITYRLAQLLSPNSPGVALVAVGVHAFAPQYVFLGSVITNDILLAVLGAGALYFMLRMVVEGPTLGITLALGAVTALALLTKYLALAYLPVVALTLLFALWLHRTRRFEIEHSALATVILLAPIVILGGWWLLRNLHLAGVAVPRDPVSQAAIRAGLIGEGEIIANVSLIGPALVYGFKTFWVSFGWGNVGADDWVYGVWLVLVIGGILGTLFWVRRTSLPRRGALLLTISLFTAAVVALPLLRELIHNSPFLRGRYMMSLAPVLAWLIAQGWQQLSGRFWPWMQKLLVLWPATLSIALIPWLILPSYAPPSPIDPAAAPGATVNAVFGDSAELVKAYVDADVGVTAGKGLPVTLTWRVLARTKEPYTLAIHLVGPGGVSYGGVTTYPGRGNAATSVWQPGLVFSETYWIPTEARGPTPATGRIAISFFRPNDAAHYLPVKDRQGALIGDSLFFGELRIEPPASEPRLAPVDQPAIARFGGIVDLLAARIPETPQRAGWAIPIQLQWRVRNAPPRPLKLTAQLLDANGAPVAISDGSPTPHLSPHLWRAEDRLQALHWLRAPDDIAPGRYRLIIALYYADDLARLSATDAQGRPLPASAWTVGDVVIE
ncbi:MAG: hypothetical protein GXP42_08570 [Chloroflexi bacterium]|nr:hypothetical protein [Chloroflexota bacterium]